MLSKVSDSQWERLTGSERRDEHYVGRDVSGNSASGQFFRNYFHV